jgi:acetyl-CoA carboxylase biotin carboxyl carrier protein
MDITVIKRLIRLAAQYDIAELELRQDAEGHSLRITRKTTPDPVVINTVAPVAAAALQSVPAAVAPGAESPPTPAPSGYTQKSPMVGTFYRAASPTATPFFEVGQRVEVGQTVCIIEAMKILNQIEAEKAGILSAILAENGQPVEYGQPLLVIQ